MIEKIKKFFTDSLFRNSFYLMLNTAMQAGFGFIFWMICARIYEPSEVGLATSLISAATLTSVFSMLGFNSVIVRFLSTAKNKDTYLSTALSMTSIASVVAAAIFLAWAFITKNPSIQSDQHPFLLISIFVLFVFSITTNSIVESAFIANRIAKYVLIKNVVLSILKPISLVLIGFFLFNTGFVGIVSSIAIPTLIAFILGYIWLIKKFDYHTGFGIDKEVLSTTRKFAIGNYLGTLFGVLPSTILVLIVVSRLSPQDAAFLYIPSMILSLLNVIPGSTAQSLFAEVSHNEKEFLRFFKKSLKHLFAFLIPAVVLIWTLGGFVLSFFGKDYAMAGTQPLQILALAGLIGATNYLGDTLLNIKKLSGMYLFMNIFNSLAVIIPAYIFAPYGLVAIAWAVLFGQLLTAIIYLVMNWKLLLSLRISSPSPSESVLQ